MYSMRYVGGHVQVYDLKGKFLFSADTEREAREELEELVKKVSACQSGVEGKEEEVRGGDGDDG